MTTFFERLQEERKRLKMNQADFGNAMGVGKTTQINYESGKRKPDVEYLENAHKIGADVKYIITGARDGSMLTPMQQALIATSSGATNERIAQAITILAGGTTAQAVDGSIQNFYGSTTKNNISGKDIKIKG